MNKQYNGYKNYETWCVTLWLENDQSTYAYWREHARQQVATAPRSSHMHNGCWTADEAAKFLLADQLKQEFDEANPLDKADVWADLLGAALDEVDWHEVADQFLTDFLTDAPSASEDEPSPPLASAAASTTSPAAVTANGDGTRFPLGYFVITAGAVDVVSAEDIALTIARHLRGDWGFVGAEDWQANDRALREGDRLLSSYDTESGRRFWIITEADRSTTTILLPDEY